VFLCRQQASYHGAIIIISHVSAKATKVVNLLQHDSVTCTPAKLPQNAKLSEHLFDYASVVWDPHTLKSVSLLDTIQNYAA